MAHHPELARCQDRRGTPDRCIADAGDRFVPVRDDELVTVLKQQLSHERDARKATDKINADLIRMYHEIAMASTQFGIEIGKGMQEQGKARQIGDEPSSNSDTAPTVRTVASETLEPPQDLDAKTAGNHNGDNPSPETRTLRVQ